MRRTKRGTTVATAALLASCLIAAAAEGGPEGSRQDARLTFTQPAPGRSSGIKFQVDYVNPSDPNAKPPAVRRVALRLRRGAVIDTDVPEKCEASDAELMAQGESACSAASRVGTGVITVDSGSPGPTRFVTADVVLLNNTDELIFLSTVRGTGVRVVTHTRVVDGHVTVSKAPMLPGTPPDGGAIDNARTRLKAIGRTIDGERRAYITTPPRCPPTGEWINRARFRYADDVTQVTTNPSACTD